MGHYILSSKANESFLRCSHWCGVDSINQRKSTINQGKSYHISWHEFWERLEASECSPINTIVAGIVSVRSQTA